MIVYNTDITINADDLNLSEFIEERGHEEVADILRDDFDYKVISSDDSTNEIDDLTPSEIWNYLFKEHSKWVTSEQHGKNVVKHDLHLKDIALDEEMAWLELCNNYPIFLAEKIGQLVLGGANGNT